jgi:UPF0042 nucleotide-binding protein
MTAQRIVFVTGLSGAGKSQTMKTFEDLGFYCVDNLPPALVPRTLELLDEARIAKAAVALDVRSGGPLGDAFAAIGFATRDHRRIDVLFLDARDETLVRRYSETRRRHPFAAVGALRDAIEAERTALASLRERATHEIDTTGATLATLKERIVESFAPDTSEHRLGVNFVAFGFKYGIPLDLDLLFDVRFLRNPNYVDELQRLTGTAASVAAFIEDDPGLSPFLEKTFALLDFLLPQYLAEGKAQLTIGVGCTGGRHRSVYVARRLAEHFEADSRFAQSLDFRDANR